MWGARKWIRCATIRCSHVPAASHVQPMYKYQSLEAWKRAHAAAVLVMRVTDEPHHPFPSPFYRVRILRKFCSDPSNCLASFLLRNQTPFSHALKLGGVHTCFIITPVVPPWNSSLK